jgi:hypothetical protein
MIPLGNLDRFATLEFAEVHRMQPLTLDPPMADEKIKNLSVKLHPDVIESARIVSAFRGETMTDMLSEILRPIMAKMEQEAITKRTKTKKDKP